MRYIVTGWNKRERGGWKAGNTLRRGEAEQRFWQIFVIIIELESASGWASREALVYILLVQTRSTSDIGLVILCSRRLVVCRDVCIHSEITESE
jgi:hypothetical protein